jgi:hypothetical protein
MSAGAALLLAAHALGCAAALHEPPPLAEMAGTSQVLDDAGAAALQGEAQALFDRRELDPARQAARLQLQASLNESLRRQALIAAARILVWITDHDPDAGVREAAAIRAVDAGIWCRRTAPQDAACDYWLGAALGVQARERQSTGFSALPEVEAAFLRVAAAAPDLDHATGERSLAFLYLRAPGWPSGPGDPDLGLMYARAAVERYPDYPPNLLVMAEALEKTGDREGARTTWQRAAVAAGQAMSAGDPDGPEWLADAETGLAGPGNP